MEKIELPEGQSKERFCELTLTLFGYSYDKTLYSAKSGLKRRMVLLGHIEDYSIPRDDRFQGRSVRIDLETAPDLEWYEQIKIEEEIDSACGQLGVKANVEAKQYETYEEEPISAFITVTPEAFEAIHRQASEAFDRDTRQIMSATITLVGKSLPETDDPETASRFGVKLTDLDVSAYKVYAVGGFEIVDRRPFYHLRDRVLSVERRRDEDWASLRILLTAAGYKFDIERGMAHSIWCAGRVISGSGKPYEGAKVTVKFEEWWTHELPETAFFGEFSYRPKPPDEDYSSDPPFRFDLRHVPDDTRDLLIPLFTQEAGTEVTLNVRLANEEEELLAATDELHGNVWRYDFEVRRHFGNDSR